MIMQKTQMEIVQNKTQKQKQKEKQDLHNISHRDKNIDDSDSFEIIPNAKEDEMLNDFELVLKGVKEMGIEYRRNKFHLIEKIIEETHLRDNLSDKSIKNLKEDGYYFKVNKWVKANSIAPLEKLEFNKFWDDYDSIKFTFLDKKSLNQTKKDNRDLGDYQLMGKEKQINNEEKKDDFESQ